MSNLDNKVGSARPKKVNTALATVVFLGYMSLSSGCAFFVGQLLGGSNAVMVRSEYNIIRDDNSRMIRIQTFYWDRNGEDDDGDGKLEEDFTTYEKRPL